jgi:hypothetical protein
VLSTPAPSRITPSVTRAATPRLFMRAHRMSPKMPASVTPSASATAITPSGMSSIAPLVERGEDQDSGVARSSRAGTKRSVKARSRSSENFLLGAAGLEPATRRPASPFGGLLLSLLFCFRVFGTGEIPRHFKH